MGPIRQSLSHKSASGSAGTRHLCVRIPGKDHANQKEIGNSREIPYLCCVFLPSYRPHGILTATPGFVRAWFRFPVPARLASQQVTAQASARSRPAVNKIPGQCVEFNPAITPYAPYCAAILGRFDIPKRDKPPETGICQIFISSHCSRRPIRTASFAPYETTPNHYDIDKAECCDQSHRAGIY